MCKSVKFEAMNETQRAGWLRWADSHDWGGGRAEYVQHPEKGFCMKVQCAAFDVLRNRTVETAFCKSPRELREWAGY